MHPLPSFVDASRIQQRSHLIAILGVGVTGQLWSPCLPPGSATYLLVGTMPVIVAIVVIATPSPIITNTTIVANTIRNNNPSSEKIIAAMGVTIIDIVVVIMVVINHEPRRSHQIIQFCYLCFDLLISTIVCHILHYTCIPNQSLFKANAVAIAIGNSQTHSHVHVNAMDGCPTTKSKHISC